MEEKGLGNNIAIATSEYHQYRASQIAKSLGFSVGAVSGHTAWWLFPTFYMRELYGILYQALQVKRDCYLYNKKIVENIKEGVYLS